MKALIRSMLVSSPILLGASLASTYVHSHGDLAAMAAEEKSTLAGNTYKVFAPSEELARKAVISFHGNLIETNYDLGYMIMTLDETDIERLEKFGFKVELATDYVEKRSLALDAMPQLSMSAQLASGIPQYACYETVEETFSEAAQLASTYSNLAQWIDVGDSWQKGAGNGGFDMSVLKLTNKNVTGDKPVLFVNSAIHAREYATAPLNLSFAKYLLEGYGTDADATWILDHHEVHLMLVTNPDGRKKAETGILWRKNHNESESCWRNSNLDGVDLNRNFTTTWGTVSGGSSGSTCNETYRGDSPGSEPEIKAIESYVRGLWPDGSAPTNSNPAPSSTTGIHIDVHSYGELILWPWGNTDAPAPNAQGLTTLGRKFAGFNDYMPQQAVGLYPTDGTSDNVSYTERGIPAYTFELGTAFFQDCSSYESTIKPKNLEALVYAAKVVGAPYVTPSGPDITAIALSDNAASAGVEPGTFVTLTATATDGNYGNRNGTEATQNISEVRYFINKAPWENGATPITIPVSANAKTKTVSSSIDTTDWAEGKYTIYVQAKDTTNTWGAVTAEFLKITNDPIEPPTNFFESTETAAIPDNSPVGASTSINVTRSGSAGAITVAVDISHTWIGDLKVELIAPSGSSYVLHDNSGGSANNINQSYSLNLTAEAANGQWTLKAVDSANRDTGSINKWSLTFPSN